MSCQPTTRPAHGYRAARLPTQLASLLVFALIPVLGIFRIDLASASLLLFGQHVYLREFPVVAGLALVLATGPLLTYSTIGTVWCGWSCPQNTLSEWATRLTHRLLGRRANVDVESSGLRVAPSKNRLGNWLLLGAVLLGTALVVGILPLLYFFPPAVVWALLTGEETAQFSSFLYRLYFVSALAVLVDVAVFRFFWCNYLCAYRYGQLLFRRSEALHVAYDTRRSADCVRCNACRVHCVTGVDPTNLKFFDRCIACGECIDACARLHARRAPPEAGLLRFEGGLGGGGRGPLAALRTILSRLGWHGLLFFAGCGLLLLGMLHAR